MTGFETPTELGAAAPAVPEGELRVWGGGVERQAAWARELLARALREGDAMPSRDDLRYAVTSRYTELALVWPAGRRVLYVAPNGDALLREADAVTATDYEAFLAGERTTLDEPSDLAAVRAEAHSFAEALAARTGLTSLPAERATLLSVTDRGDMTWDVRLEDGGFVAYEIQRGHYDELARGASLADVLPVIESSARL